MWLGSAHDPMVLASTVRLSLAAAGERLEVRILDVGGHVGFPGQVPIDDRTAPFEQQLIDWIETQDRGTHSLVERRPARTCVGLTPWTSSSDRDR